MAVGDIEINKFTVDSVDLNDPNTIGLVGFNIYEDLFQPLGSYGEVRLVDYKDVLGEYNITGKENIELQFKLSDIDSNSLNYKFKLFQNKNLDDGSLTATGSMHNKQYTLRFVSKPYIESSKNRVNKSFNEPTSSAVEKIAKENFKVDKIEIKTTTKSISKIAHKELPLKVIRDFDNLHVGTNGESLFYLFETSDGENRKHVFDSMENMMKQSPVVKLKQTTLLSNGISKDDDRQNSILWFRSNNFDSSTRFMADNTQVTYNPATGRTRDPRRTDSKPKVAGNYIFGEKESNSPVKTPEHHLYNPFNEKNKNEVAIMKEKKAKYLSHITQNYADLEIPGNPKITLGSMIEIDIPKKSYTDNEKGEKQFNGKSLVVGIRHKIKPLGQTPRYTMILRIIKGGFEEGGENNG